MFDKDEYISDRYILMDCIEPQLYSNDTIGGLMYIMYIIDPLNLI